MGVPITWSDTGFPPQIFVGFSQMLLLDTWAITVQKNSHVTYEVNAT